jgi:hypothetical protein
VFCTSIIPFSILNSEFISCPNTLFVLERRERCGNSVYK